MHLLKHFPCPINSGVPLLFANTSNARNTAAASLHISRKNHSFFFFDRLLTSGRMQSSAKTTAAACKYRASKTSLCKVVLLALKPEISLLDTLFEAWGRRFKHTQPQSAYNENGGSLSRRKRCPVQMHPVCCCYLCSQDLGEIEVTCKRHDPNMHRF